MKPEHPASLRVLAFAATSAGFGYAVLDGNTLVDWGVKEDGKQTGCLSKAESFISRYRPEVMVLEDFKWTKRGYRAKLIIQGIIDLAPKHSVGVMLFSRSQIYEAFFAGGKGTKEALAELLAERFPDELGIRLPPKRKAWTSEDRCMAAFDAVALGLMAGLAV